MPKKVAKKPSSIPLKFFIDSFNIFGNALLIPADITLLNGDDVTPDAAPFTPPVISSKPKTISVYPFTFSITISEYAFTSIIPSDIKSFIVYFVLLDLCFKSLGLVLSAILDNNSNAFA